LVICFDQFVHELIHIPGEMEYSLEERNKFKGMFKT